MFSGGKPQHPTDHGFASDIFHCATYAYLIGLRAEILCMVIIVSICSYLVGLFLAELSHDQYRKHLSQPYWKEVVVHSGTIEVSLFPKRRETIETSWISAATQRF